MFLQKFKKFLGQLNQNSAFSPESFKDPVAIKTEWGPLKGGGSNFQTKRIKIISEQRIQFVPTIGMLIFASIFFVVGIGSAFIPFFMEKDNVIGDIETAMYVPLIFGGIFASVGGALLYSSTRPIVFDKTQDYFWKSRKEARELFNPEREKNFTQLEKIYAIQVIPELVRSKDNSYYSYELNLILKDAQRVNVLDHGNLEKIRSSAETISKFLNVPAWDTTLHAYNW